MKTRQLLLQVCMAVAIVLMVVGARGQSGKAQWNQFRGHNGQGVSNDNSIPVHFGPNERLLWKTAIPAGHSAPVIWNDRVFVTALGSPKGDVLVTMALSRKTGKILWRQIVKPAAQSYYHPLNNPASPTPAVDDKLVYVYFGTYGLLCYDHDGHPMWERRLPPPASKYGAATSPIIYRNTVILVLDSDDGSSRLLAFEKATGRTVWERPRPLFTSGWSTPMIFRHNGIEDLVVLGSKRLTAYDPATGVERWGTGGFSNETVGIPVTGEDLLFASAAALGGRGDDALDAESTWKMTINEFDKNHDGKIQRGEMTKGFAFIQRPDLPKENPGYGLPIKNMDQLLGIFDRDKNGEITESEWMLAMGDFAAASHPKLVAIRLGPNRDAQPVRIVWEIKRGVPETASPLYCRSKLFLLRDGGQLTCLNATTGAEIYRDRLGAPGQYIASPIAVGDKIITASVPGIVSVVQIGDSLKVLARNNLGESIYATPAVADGTLYIRTISHLYAFTSNKH